MCVPDVGLSHVGFLGIWARALLGAGCDCSVVDAEGPTALHEAAGAGAGELVEMLLGERPWSRDQLAEPFRIAPFSVAFRFGRDRNATLLVLKKG